MDAIQEMLVKMLKRCKLFKDMSDNQLAHFAQLFKLEMASKQEAIILEGKNPEHIYVLKNGDVVAKKANGLNSITLGKVSEGEVFGEMSFFYKKPAMASVICQSDTCSFWKISRKDFEEFLDLNPELKTKVAEILAKREKENQETLGKPNNNKIDDDIHINL